MATTLNHGRSQSRTIKARTPMPADPSCQPCPACGGLECLCRPRFFAGQLLSEQDLNRLDHYITEKHKLHNRHLFGSGVVCGLEVTCAPCDGGFVQVGAGYALSPCGEDIVVCKPDTVDICALIDACRTDSEPDCAPYRGQQSCGDVIEDWILAVRYAESPSRGVTALTGAGQGCGCSCGTTCSGKCGGSGGSCGCGGGATCSCGVSTPSHATETLRQPKAYRGAPPSCEPTVVCETYRYDVFKAPDPKDDPKGEVTGISGVFAQLEGEMMARVACCIKEIEDALPAPPHDISDPILANERNAWFQWGCRMRAALANYFVRTGGHDCAAIAKLQAIVIPNPTQPISAFEPAMGIVIVQFIIVIFEALVDCFCSNALPPCPPAGDPRVPLAVVKVRRGDCRVISICNWHPMRKHVLTFPTLSYWFGAIPIERLLRDIMHLICCDLFGLRDFFANFLAGHEDKINVAPAPAPPPPPPAPVAIVGAPAMGVAAAATAEEASSLSDAGAKAFSLDEAISVDLFSGLKMETGVFEALAARHAAGGAPSWAALGAAIFGGQNVRVDPKLKGADRTAAIFRTANTGPMEILAGMFASAPSPVSLGVAVSGKTRDADITELRSMLASQAAEINALKAQMKAKSQSPGGGNQ